MQDCPFWQPVITIYATVKAQPPRKHHSQTAQKAVFPPHQQKQMLLGTHTRTAARAGAWSTDHQPPRCRGMQSWNSSLSLINVCRQLWTVITTLTNIQGWHFESGPSGRSDSGDSCPEKDIKCFQWGGTGRLPTFQKTVSSSLLVQTSAKVQLQKKSPPCSTALPYFSPSSSSPLPTTCGEAELLQQTRRQQALATTRCRSTELREQTKRKRFNYKGRKLSDELPCSISQFNGIRNS